MLLVGTHLVTVSQAMARLSLKSRAAVLMAVKRGTLRPSDDDTVRAPNGKVVAYLFTETEIERYAREDLGRHGPKPKPTGSD